ncbi:hypothetical protein, partial [Zavarzinella formosa]|uniref:hypothetical protein n=1 Tax=Zavarzinella formosa TaxID=360055 RepID=UPI001EE655D0
MLIQADRATLLLMTLGLATTAGRPTTVGRAVGTRLGRTTGRATTFGLTTGLATGAGLAATTG